MAVAWSESDLAAKSCGPDGRRYPANPAYAAGPDGEPVLLPAVSQNVRAAAGLGSTGMDAGHARKAPSQHRPLSTAALRRLTPEQRLQIEVVRLALAQRLAQHSRRSA